MNVKRGDQDPIRLDLNENHLLSDEYYDIIYSRLDVDLADYPSEYCSELCEKLAGYHGLSPEQFLVANGSDMVLDTIFKTLVPSGGLVGYYEPSYRYYTFLANRNDRKVLEVPLRSDFTIPTNTDFIEEVDALVVCSPNNPTSLSVDKKHIESLLEKDVLIVLDEAYAEYGSEYGLNFLKDHDNLIVTRTFSKAWGLAGVRVGYAVSSPQNIMLLKENMMSFNMNVLSNAAVLAALENHHFMEEALERTFVERDYLTEELSLVDFNVLPSETNFLFCRPPHGVSPEELYQGLSERDIMIKIFDEERIRDYVRITVGTREINDELLDNLEDLV
ncbi:MAG: pyridoxal phosphate-dependent aminotransferase [Candidatus Saliniplasma sp.]